MSTPDQGPPDGPDLTAFDRHHLKTYVRLLDAQAAGADWREAAAQILALDVEADPQGTQRIYARYLRRARWLADQGYRGLLRP